MKFLILASIIVFSVIGIVGIQESFAEKASGKPAWDTSGEKVCGDRLCSELERVCTDEDYTNMIPTMTRGHRHAQLQIFDIHGNVPDKITVDSQLQITPRYFDDPNPPPNPYCISPIVGIIQIQDTKDNTTVFLGWNSGMMKPDKMENFSISWIPKQEGTYTATLFFWKSLEDPLSFAPPVTSTITVSD